MDDLFSYRRGCSSAGTNVGACLTKLLRCCQQRHCSGGCTLHPESHGERPAECARKRLCKVVDGTHGLRDDKGYKDG